MEFTPLQKALIHFATLEVETDTGIKKFKLVLDMNALARAQEELSKDFSLGATWFNGMTSFDIVKMCWYALKRYHPEIEWEEVGSWFCAGDIEPLKLKLLELTFPGTIERINNKSTGEEKDAAQEVAS